MDIAICCIVKDEPFCYLKEFIKHHLSIGFDKIFIYNNNDNIDYQETDFKKLKDEFGDNLDIIFFEGKCKQFEAYIDCTEKNKEKYDWVAYIDADELIEVERASIKDILKDVTAPALGLNWQIFGSGEYNGTSQIKSFINATKLSFDSNKHVKIIANPKEIELINNPHNFIFKNNGKAVNIFGDEIDTFYTTNTTNRVVWINHYYCRTDKDKETKMERGRADSKENYGSQIFDIVDNETYVETHSIAIEEQRGKHIALITPTGNREFQIKLCEKYMERQNFTGHVDWYIIDDCIPYTTDFIKEQCKRSNWNIYIIHPSPSWKEGDNTQGRNLKEGLKSIIKANIDYDGIFFIEDDDWYSSDYLFVTLRNLEGNDITGGVQALYWNIPNNTTSRCNNFTHSSLCQTAIKMELIQDMIMVIDAGNKYFDMDFYFLSNRKRRKINLFKSFPEICIGVKGLTGRPGIGGFHKIDNQIFRPTFDDIQDIIGSDYESYQSKM